MDDDAGDMGAVIGAEPESSLNGSPVESSEGTRPRSNPFARDQPVSVGTYTFNVTGPVDFSVDVTAGDTWTSTWLPLGTYTVSEVDPPADHAITNNPAVIDDDGETVMVVATNGYPEPTGALSITKVESGAAAPGGTYTFDIDGPGDMDFPMTVTAGATATVTDLPFGQYTISEVDAPAGHSIEPNPVVLGEEVASVMVTARNAYPAGQLRIAKVVNGQSAPAGRTRST